MALHLVVQRVEKMVDSSEMVGYLMKVEKKAGFKAMKTVGY